MAGIDWILIGLALIGVVPAVCGVLQVILAAANQWFNHASRIEDHPLPRIVVLVPAWNEADVLSYSIDSLLALDYPPARLRVVVIDDASTDQTPLILRAKTAHYRDRFIGLRRDAGGQGKAH